MSNYSSPGVYIMELSSGTKPIAGVGTSVAAFIGLAALSTAPNDKAVFIPNWSRYVDTFGGFDPNCYLPYAVFSFFAEGGTGCYVVKVADSNADFIGDSSSKKGLHALDLVDDVSFISIPDKAGDADTVRNAYTYCKNRRDCFFIADPPYGATPSNLLTNFVKGSAPFNSSYAALYYPWVKISNPLGGQIAIPPSGLVAGTYAYTDSIRGVHKAPAGIVEGFLDSAVGVERIVTQSDNNILYDSTAGHAPVNVIRSLPEGICIWGARTLSQDPEWPYINVRRLFIYLEKSIEIGTQWVVFEPNSPTLWSDVKRNLTAFLTRVWRDGALFGSTPDEAFFVKVDADNNPPEVRDVGQLIIEVGVAPVKPAEYVWIRIVQKTLTK